VEKLSASGRYSFTTRAITEALGLSVLAARAALRRLKAKGVVATPHRGFHVIVPPEYRWLGCLPPEQVSALALDHLGIPYYAGLLSAAEIHGAAHQRPQLFQVVVPRNRSTLRCGKVRVQFVARRNVALMPTAAINTPRGPLRVSTREVTAIDVIGYARHCGGLGNVATVVAELAEELEPDALVHVARMSPVPWGQRLGFLLDLAGYARLTGTLAQHVDRVAREYVPLRPGKPARVAERNPRWRLLVNEAVELEA